MRSRKPLDARVRELSSRAFDELGFLCDVGLTSHHQQRGDTNLRNGDGSARLSSHMDRRMSRWCSRVRRLRTPPPGVSSRLPITRSTEPAGQSLVSFPIHSRTSAYLVCREVRGRKRLPAFVESREVRGQCDPSAVHTHHACCSVCRRCVPRRHARPTTGHR